METRDSLKLGVAQPVTHAHDVKQNAERHAHLVAQAQARVVVFPELSLTGYELDAQPVEPNDNRLSALRAACAEARTTALVGAPITNDGNDYIAMLAIDRSGVRVVYRKMWLGDVEAQRFTPGTEPAVLTIDGWRLGLAICKDTGVTQHADDTVACGIDIYVAGVLEASDDAHVTAERAQRVTRDHAVWVATASFAGSTGGGFDEAGGGSGVWRPDGSTAARLGSEAGLVTTFVIDDVDSGD